MPLSDGSIKQSLVFVLTHLRDHDAKLDQIHHSLQALVNVLAQRSPEFRDLYTAELQQLEQTATAYGPQGSETIVRSIDEMILLVQMG